MPIVSFNDKKTEKKIELEISENEILYNGLEDRGVVLPHGCLAGSCGACRIEVTEGADHLSTPGAIESNTLAALYDQYKKEWGEEKIVNKVIRLSCRAKITGDISIQQITK
ncbi:MAG: 2Fe-2S iron-sulfur cluster-binding protein [Bacteriovoracaceae bacterium]